MINPNPLSERSLGFARASLDHCLNSEKHKLCPKLDSIFMPKRLVKISESSSGQREISLFEPQDTEVHPYVALSYCWGGEQPLSTTTATLERYRRSMLPTSQASDESLPSTIQDAIFITHNLGFSLLWIDAFCICQDDQEEKAIEISLMPSIYRHAVVTIAATNSSKVKDGFLHPRKVAEETSAAFRLQWRDSGQDSYYPLHQNKPASTEPYTDILLMQKPDNVDVEEPLDFRAWAFQERVLAPRVLEYGTHRLRWICPSTELEHHWTDGWTAKRLQPGLLRSLRTGWNKNRLDAGERLLPVKSGLAHPSAPQESDEADLWPKGITAEDLTSATRQWQDIVAHYTGRALSVKTDRILAISGIAERFNAINPGHYLAGLWLPHLPGGLLWKIEMPWTKVGMHGAQSCPPRQLRPQEYLGPSWSWVAVSGRVDFEDCLFSHYKVAAVSDTIPINQRSLPDQGGARNLEAVPGPRAAPNHKGVRIKLDLTSIDGTLVEAKARYGAVSRCSIWCRARMRSALWVNELLDQSESGGPAQVLLLDSKADFTEQQIRVGIEADCLEEEFLDAPEGSKSIPVFLLEVVEHDVRTDFAPELPEDDDFLEALFETAFAPFNGKVPKTFSDFLTPKRLEQLMAAHKPEQSRRPTEWQTRGLVLRRLTDGTYSRVGIFKHQWGSSSSPQPGNLRAMTRVPRPPQKRGEHIGDNSGGAAEERYMPGPLLTTASESIFAGLEKVDVAIV
jgi:Heterokaryon incompatibility protein (HET)